MSSSSTQPVKLLYIAGSGRSGSTLLGGMLGQVNGFFYGGELMNIGPRSIGENRLCGCGVPIGECPVWTAVLKRSFGGVDAAYQALGAKRVYDPLRKLPTAWGPIRRRFIDSLGPFRQDLGRLHRGIAEETGCRVIVDSSHVPLYGAVLESLPEVELYVVHLVRDARAVAYSWLRPKTQPDPTRPFEMKQDWTSLTAAMWSVSNWKAERFFRHRAGRYVLVRYEDLVANPRGEIQRILHLIGEPLSGLRFHGPTTVELAATHCVFGNPDRFKLGEVGLRLDDEWRRKLKSTDWATVTAWTWPGLWRYGYLSEPAPAVPRREATAEASA